MIVRRFVGWLRGWLVGSLEGMRARARVEECDEQEPICVGVGPRVESTEQASPTLTLSSWLDNGRRLRPRLRLASSLRESDKRTTRPLRYRPPSVNPQPQAEVPTPHINIAPLVAEPVESTPATPVAPATPTVPSVSGSGDDLEDLERLDGDTRRLMLLRHLVRQRVFNEGFASDSIPQQYQKSHGGEALPPHE